MHFVRGSTWIYIDPAPGNLKGIITDFQESQFGCGSFHHLQLFILTCYLIEILYLGKPFFSYPKQMEPTSS